MASSTRLDSIELFSHQPDAERVTHTDTVKMGFFRQLGLLLWKNFVIKRRKVCVSIFEVALPLLFAGLLVVIRQLANVEVVNTNTSYLPAEITIVDTNFDQRAERYLFFAPNTTATEAIMADVRDSINNASERHSLSYYEQFPMEIRGFDSEAALVTTYQASSADVSYGVIFNDVKPGQTTLPDKLKVTLRPKPVYRQLWGTQNKYPLLQNNAPRTNRDPAYQGQGFQDLGNSVADSDDSYKAQGFLYLEKAVAEAVVRYRNPSADLSSLSVREHRMPYPPYSNDQMINVLQAWFPFYIMLSFLLSAIQTTKNIVYEKERKLKESMKLIGLSPAAHWTSWFLTVFIYMTLAVALFSLIFGVSFTPKGRVLSTTNIGLFFVFLLCYAIALIAYCFMISVFVQKANIGAAVSGILYFGFYTPYFVLQPRYADLSRGQKMASCILFNMAMALGGNCIGLYEGTGVGAQWSNFHESASVDDDFSLLDAMIMLLVDAALYFFITWYVDNVYPGEFGIAKPFYFPFTKTYWCGSKQLTDEDIKAGSVANLRDQHFEQEPESLVRGITITDLKKVYGRGGGAKTAVAGISMNMYENQITVLLGHNGAGKTTTMSMLTGFIQPTSGTAVVNGYDIRTDIESVRQNLGLCPQHDILFDSMTVTEHLDFFARLKGCPADRVSAEVEATIQEVGLKAKQHDQAGHLSGGQKRKLSVGIALIAGSKVVILDESSSGMDPSARRHIWEVLKKNRAGRTIMLSTHFMDEADILGDRIAIMAEGVIKCCGTSMFLKKLYGAGYHLVVVAEDNCEVDRVTSVVQEHVAEAELESRTGMELRYLLPESKSAAFPALFRALDDKREQLRIGSYGTSATTMEEVFLKVGESRTKDNDEVEEEEEVQPNVIVNPAYSGDNANGSAMANGVSNGHVEPKPSTAKNGKLGVVNHGFASDGRSSDGVSMLAQQSDFLEFNRNFTKKRGLDLELARFRGMFVKKALHTRRNYILSGVQLLLPVIFTIIALVSAKGASDVTMEPSLTLDLAPFGTTTVPCTDGVTPTAFSTNLSNTYAGLFSGSSTAEKMIRSAYPTTDDYFLAKAASIGIATFNKRVLVGGEFEDYTSNVTVTAHYNGQPYHTRPIALALVLDTVLKTFGGSAFSLEFANYPLPKEAKDQGSFKVETLGFTVGFCISFGMSFLIASFVYFLIRERITGAKHLQVVSGVGPKVFWLSNLCWDYINYAIPCLVILPIFVIFDTKAYSERLGVVLLLLLLYGWASLPCMYLIQYLFQAPATGVVIVIVISVVTGLATTLLVFILQIPGLGKPDVGNALNWVFLAVFPNFDLGKSFMDVYVNYDNHQKCANVTCSSITSNPCCPQACAKYGFCIAHEDDYLAWAAPGVGRYAVFMAIQGAVFFALVMAVEYRLPQRLWYAVQGAPVQVDVSREPSPSASSSEDSDVLQERMRLSGKDFASLPDSLVLQDVYRRYGGFVAVDHITVGIQERTCFGLLGQNGAGKTTTFKMLTGDVMLSGGNAICMGYDVKTHIKQVQENLGYCPQFDALIDQMTGRETLVMFARLRGVPESSIPTVVNKLIEIMMLEKHAEKLTSQYSGGNKRKLSTALALIGDPPFIMLDEPTTGMDPAARRQLWTVLSRVRDSGRTLVLTSHSMEECDALCTRIAIMVNGQFKCMGTPQHLKTKYAQGYTIIVRVDDDILNQMTDFLRERFQEVEPATDQQGYLRFQIRDGRVRLAELFEAMEASRQQLNVLDYSVHQTTLEQVFLAFTANQQPPKEDKKSFFKRICACRS